MIPPRWLHQLFRFCAPASRPDLEGDFLEMYAHQRESMSKQRTHLHWVMASLRLLPLKWRVPNSSKNSNFPLIMLRMYVKTGSRNLWKNKGYSAINILGLGIGIAVCLLITLYVRDEQSYDKHFNNHENTYRLVGSYNNGGEERTHSALTPFLLKSLIEGQFSGIENLARLDYYRDILIIEGKATGEENMLIVDSSYFEVFDHTFVLGEPSSIYDPGRVVIDTDAAQRLFGKESPIGRTVEIQGRSFEVSALVEPLPKNTHFEGNIFIPVHGVLDWYPAWITENMGGLSHYLYLSTYSDNPEQLISEINDYTTEQWEYDTAPIYSLQQLSDIHLTSDLANEIMDNGSQSRVRVFLATALVILLLAAINYINLSMASAVQRSREVGLKKVLGAPKLTQYLQFQVESLVITFLGGLLALGLVSVGLPYFNQLTVKTLSFDHIFSPPILLGLIGTLVPLGLITGSFPALFLLKIPTLQGLAGKLLTRGKQRFNLRNSLVVAQFFLAITLIISTLSILNQIQFLKNKDLGINPNNVVIVPMQNQEMREQFDVVRERLLASPAVVGVSASSHSVTQRIGGWRGYRLPGVEQQVSAPTISVTHDFLENMGAEFLVGRNYHRDFPTDGTSAYIINEAAVEFFNLEEPMGASLRGATFTGSEWGEKDAKVIGIVKNFHFASLHESVRPVVFSLHTEATSTPYWLQVRLTENGKTEGIALLERLWKEYIPDRPFDYSFMTDDLNEHYTQEDTLLKVLTVFAGLSIFIGCLGLFGITAFIMKRRTREIGIRKVLGANQKGLVSLLSRDFMILILVSNAMGWPLAYYLMKNWLENFAYQAPFAWWTLLATAGGALALAFLTIAGHTIKATKANPVVALRQE